jgi:hypothetical protein
MAGDDAKAAIVPQAAVVFNPVKSSSTNLDALNDAVSRHEVKLGWGTTTWHETFSR